MKKKYIQGNPKIKYTKLIKLNKKTDKKTDKKKQLQKEAKTTATGDIGR